MNSNTEDHVGTLIKVLQFFADNPTLTQDIESFSLAVETLAEDTESVFQFDSIATRLLGGSRTVKEEAHLALQNKILLVRAGCISYYTANHDASKLGMLKFPDSKVSEARDNDLYVIAEQVHSIASPIKLLLSAFQVTEADVNAIPTLKSAYKAVLQLPRMDEGINKAAAIERDKLVGKCFKQTLPDIDNYMLPYKYTNSFLYNLYLTARAIDNSGGGSDSSGYTVQNYVMGPGQSVFFHNLVAADKHIYLRQLGGNTGITVCTGAVSGVACGAGHELIPNATLKTLFGDLNIGTGSYINFSNHDSVTITVRAGFKN